MSASTTTTAAGEARWQGLRLHYTDGVDLWCPVTAGSYRTPPGDTTCPTCGPVRAEVVPLAGWAGPARQVPRSGRDVTAAATASRVEARRTELAELRARALPLYANGMSVRQVADHLHGATFGRVRRALAGDLRPCGGHGGRPRMQAPGECAGTDAAYLAGHRCDRCRAAHTARRRGRA